LARLLETKLKPPPLRMERVFRPRLYEHLDAFDSGVVVVSAPAGFGKSTLVVEWLDAQQRPFSWYSLDRYDGDVGLFGEYMAKATTLLTGHESGLLSLPGEQTPDPRTMIATLVGDLGRAPPRSVLVFDDYHEIQNQDVHETINYLVDNLPEGLVVAIIARADPPLPLARLRSQSRLVDIRGADLRFSSNDVTDYFRIGFGIDIEPEQSQRIADRSDGWVSALQLSSLGADRDEPSASASLASLSTLHPHIAGYLVDEVLNRLPAELTRFLLETSTFERFDAQLCAEVTGIANAPTMIDEIERRNAFLIPLGEGRQWFRYHHLFSDLLRSRMERSDPDRLDWLLRKAAEVCDRRDLTDDAIAYALRAEDTDLACRIVDRNMERALAAGEVARLRSWLRLLDERPDRSDPIITLGWAWCRIFEGNLDAADELLDRFAASRSPQFAEDRGGDLAVMRAIVAFQRGDASAAVAHATKGLQLTPESHSYVACLGHLYMGRAFHAQALRDQARPHLERAASLAGRENALATVSALFWLGVVDMDEGKLSAAEQSMLRAQELSEGTGTDGDPDPVAGVADVGLAYIRLNQLELAEAIRHAERGTRLLKRSTFVEMVFRAYFVWAEALSVAGHSDQSKTISDEGIAWLRGRHLGGGPLETWMFMVQARNSIRQGRFEEANSTLDRVQRRGLGSPNNDEALGFYEAADALSFALRRGDLDTSSRLFAQLPEDPGGNVMFAIKRQVLVAALRELEGDRRASASAAEDAIDLASDGWRYQFSHVAPVILPVLKRIVGRTVHDSFVRSVIDRLPSEVDLKPARLPDPMTDRELEVLSVIASGYTNNEIADRLFISRGTVKRHASNIYLKLEAHHRTEAAAKGRELGLID
jgi:LuxR family maltose regulon positive regulatory protein